ncbi:MAG: HD domain-containing protein, partial [Bdellovibrionales bacterium]|nr:HD domain-containing protein [Bdellovibrionales bacterium]NQZ19737.1 HD domain-containing protein [Bdellovibrionales bacterium]
ENRFRDIEDWEKSHPIAIGSWARGELCPCSDIDVVFCGEEKYVQNVVDQITPTGIKLRYRVPENREDWTQNVEVLESNALFWGKAFTQEGAVKLQEQKEKIKLKEKSFRRELLQRTTWERRNRFKRYDSIANFLEPNLKFGAGGLRDLHQALILAHWFPEKVPPDDYSFNVLNYYKKFFLIIRQKLHLQNSHDILVGPEQPELAQWFGYEKNRDFMREVQKGLSRVSFHADWVSERCRTSLAKIKKYEEKTLQTWSEAFKVIESDSSLQAQALVRRSLYETKGFKKEKASKEKVGKHLRKAMSIKVEDNHIIALFRSQLVSHAIPNFTKIIGLVQHDQYHRFSVDAHLLQTVREVKRVFDHPKLLGKLAYYCEKLTLKDWEVLRWTALYHDIAKGSGGDHEKKGQQMVKRDLKAFGFPESFVNEVAWMVEQHLLMSTAAFRKNPRSPKTWQELYDTGVKGKRIYLLTLFTAIDIRATNPEAWSHWKEGLLYELGETLRNPSSEKYYDFVQGLKKKSLKVPPQFIEQLDLAVIESIPSRILLDDFSKILNGQELEPLVFRDKKNQIWVRFHSAKDKKGLMLEFALTLSALGCNIRQASVLTDKKMGAYDWFFVRTNKDLKVLKKQLLHNTSFQPERCSFSQIDLMSADENEWVLSFRAKDKKGLLVSAIQSIYDQNLEIIWAKVHTWGRQIEDIFGVLPLNSENPEQIVKSMKDSWESKELEIL